MITVALKRMIIMIIMVTLKRMIKIMVAPKRVIIATETMSKKYKSTAATDLGLCLFFKWNDYKLTKFEVDR